MQIAETALHSNGMLPSVLVVDEAQSWGEVRLVSAEFQQDETPQTSVLPVS